MMNDGRISDNQPNNGQLTGRPHRLTGQLKDGDTQAPLHPLTVSIIVNNYNYDTFLSQAIDSALNQGYPGVEVIVVDDGSQDGSVDVIRGYRDRIHPVIKENGGQASAMNAGFKASSGDLILFLDADDYLFPHAVSTIVAAWSSEIVQSHARLELVNREGAYIDLYPAPEIKFDQGDVTPQLLVKGRYNTTVTSGTCFSRRVLTEILPIPESDFRISADGYLVTAAPFYGPVLAIETPIGARRKHNTNAWAFSSLSLRIEQFRKSFEHDFSRYKYLKQTAEKLGYSSPTQLGEMDYLHLQDRLAYLRLAPEQYPFSPESQYRLSVLGIVAILKHSQFSWKRKLILCLWFLGLGFSPQFAVTSVIRWKFIGKSRPVLIDWLLKRLRYSTR